MIFRVLQIFKLSGPAQRVAGQQLHLLRGRLIQRSHHTAEIIAWRIHINISDRHTVLALQHRRAVGHEEIGDLAQSELVMVGLLLP
jgi:hypothetical protein